MRHVHQETRPPVKEAELLAAASRSDFLSALGSTELGAVLDRCRVTRASRNGLTLLPSEDSVMILLRGSALSKAANAQGTSTVLGVLQPGTTWGLAATLGRPSSTIEIHALTDSAALVISGTDLRRLVLEHPRIARASLQIVATELAAAREVSARFSNSSATERVLHRLVELCDRWGEHIDGRIEVMLPLTQDDLASWAWTSRESTAKVLHGLRAAGIIQTGRRELIVLDGARLADRARGAARRNTAIFELLHSVG